METWSGLLCIYYTWLLPPTLTVVVFSQVPFVSLLLHWWSCGHRPSSVCRCRSQDSFPEHNADLHRGLETSGKANVYLHNKNSFQLQEIFQGIDDYDKWLDTHTHSYVGYFTWSVEDFGPLWGHAATLDTQTHSCLKQLPQFFLFSLGFAFLLHLISFLLRRENIQFIKAL